MPNHDRRLKVKRLPRPRSRPPGIADLVDLGRFSALTMRGFEPDDLATIKAAVPMTWNGADRYWVIRDADVPDVIAVLDELGFFIRQRVVER